jgi:hypothetical protein
MEGLDDEEGVQTRWSKLETGWLLLVRRARICGDTLELKPLFGREFTVRPREWMIDAAKTIQRNLVRIDAWMIREGRACLPPALGSYVRGPLALGIVRSERNGPIYWPGRDEPSRLFYDEDGGIEHQPTRPGGTSRPSDDDLDESCD